MFNNGALEIVQGICPDPDLAFKFSSVKRMAAMLAGKPALFRIGSFYRVGLLAKLLTLLMSLTLLMPNARPKDPDKKRLKVKLSIYMMAAALSRYNKLGNPEINKWTGKQPERIYQFSVIGEDDIASYLQIRRATHRQRPA